MTEEDIEKVVKRVIEEILKKENKDDINQSLKDHILLIFTGGNGNLDTVLEELKKLNSIYSYYYILTPAAKKVIDVSKIRELSGEEINEDRLYQTINSVSTVLFPTLTQNTAAKVVNGIRDSIGSEAMAISLMTGKRVIAVSDSINLRGISLLYSNLCLDILKRLNYLGVTLCMGSNLSREVLNFTKNKKMSVNKEKKSEYEDIKQSKENETIKQINEKLITASHIETLFKDGDKVVKINKGTIMTPMAVDLAKEKGIKILNGDKNADM